MLKVLDEVLASDSWLAGPAPTLADLAMYAYTARAPEGQIDLTMHGNVNGWLRRVEGLTGFVPMLRSA